ncbi:MAG: hypothetical protein K0S42_1906 [Microvirga sp.]|nr:hypothetical protein [Microvirga sp.]
MTLAPLASKTCTLCRGGVPPSRRLPLIGIDFDEDHGGHHAEVLLKQAPEPDERVFVSDLNLRGPDLFLDLSEALLHEVSSGLVQDCPLAKLRSRRDMNRHDSPVSRKKARRETGPSLRRKKALMPSAALMPQANRGHQPSNSRRCQPAPLR